MKQIRVLWTAGRMKLHTMLSMGKARLLDLKPKDENDYYTIGRFMIGKKAALAIILAVGAVCALYLWSLKPADREKSLYKAYRYNSAALKFKSGKVRILGKSGYTAYVGDVEDGTVKGTGTLYRPDGSIVYDGAFDGNRYNGWGKLYQAEQMLLYEGEFRDNLYDGEGRLYREDGTLLYEGMFSGGSKSGKGQLYGRNEALVFTGNFWKDTILYQDFIGKSTADAADMYAGTTILYENGGGYCGYMKEIDAIYAVREGADTLEGEWRIEGVYVLSPKLRLNGSEAETIPQIREILGEPAYEGNTAFSAEEELAESLAAESGQEEKRGGALLALTAIYDDVYEITDYEKDYLGYVYRFETKELAYTFFCGDKNGSFSFYKIEG